ncbi:MAG: D-alanine--D-alanine ligase [Alphaproteobacteria bacterium]|jgi:D-alanine-D-alanine ligase
MNADRKKSVAVLEGGWSSEREVSLMGSGQIAAALTDAGYDVRRIDVRRDLRQLIDDLTPAPDVVYNALHGPYGEDGCLQGVLECLGIPYSHSGVMASAMAMDKPMAKVLFEKAGIPCAPHLIVTRDEYLGGEVMELPYVLKPLNEGSSVGVIIVRGDADKPGPDHDIWSHGSRLMIERYIAGRELTVSVMGDRALGVTELRPYEGFYDYEAKYTDGKTEHLVPAPVHPEIYAKAMDYAVRAHKALGCRGVSRSDFIYDDRDGEPGQLFILELNTQPGMTPLSLVPEQATHVGISFGELVSWMVENAACDG